MATFETRRLFAYYQDEKGNYYELTDLQTGKMFKRKQYRVKT